ncbi:Proteasome subunit beta type-4 [Capsicum chinense]|nr:Proteasome subunit beta type-4 [Capsicum chinense]
MLHGLRRRREFRQLIAQNRDLLIQIDRGRPGPSWFGNAGMARTPVQVVTNLVSEHGSWSQCVCKIVSGRVLFMDSKFEFLKVELIEIRVKALEGVHSDYGDTPEDPNLYDNMWDDGNSFGPKEVHNYLTRVVYNRRNKFNPLWNSLVLGGVKNGQKYLGSVSMIGVHYEENHVATGFGNHLVRPILRDEWHENLICSFLTAFNSIRILSCIIGIRDIDPLTSAMGDHNTRMHELRKEVDSLKTSMDGVVNSMAEMRTIVDEKIAQAMNEIKQLFRGNGGASMEAPTANTGDNGAIGEGQPRRERHVAYQMYNRRYQPEFPKFDGNGLKY